MATASTSLAQSLQKLVDADTSLQLHILERVSAHVASHEPTAAISCSVGSKASLDDVPQWSRPDGFPPLPHSEHAKPQLESEPPLRWAPVEMALTLDVFEVAQRQPSGCQALFLTSSVCIEASASAAVAAWLSCYVTFFFEERRTEDAVEASCAGGRVRRLPWPWPWCVDILYRRLKCQVRVLLLRVPSLYTAVTSGAGTRATSGRLGDAVPVTPVIATPPAPPSGEADFLTGQLSSIVPLSTELEQLPSARLTNTRSPCCAYPSDRFLECSHTVHMIGVVHQVFYECHSAALPAPWVTVLLVPLTASLPRSAFAKCGKEPPRRREVDLSLLGAPQRSAVAVIGGVIAVRGHTQVARRRACARAEAVAPLRFGEVAETSLEEYIVATWAAPVQLSTGVLQTHSCSWLSRNCADSVVEETAGAPPSATMVSPGSAARGPVAVPPYHIRSAAEGADVGSSEHCDDAAVQLTVAEEEATARAALVFWEGARLALGMEAPGQAEGKGRATWAARLFSASLDFLVASQLALVSAQMADGVVVLAVDEAVPESLLTRLLRRLDRVVPGATLEVPSSVLARAKPPFFLPSYRMQRVPAPPVSRANAPASAVYGVVGTSMGSPAARRARHHRVCVGTAVAAPPPPCYPETLQGGVLTQANGRTLVLQRIEALPAPTLKLLQEALRDEASDVEKVDVPLFGSHASERAFGSGVATSPCTASQRQREAAQTPSTNLAGATRRLIRREGGQTAKYCATHSALCSVRQGASLTHKSQLVEFAERCDVVVRPAYDMHRQTAALQGSTVPAFCELLHSRGEAWLGLLGAALALPVHNATADGPSPNSFATPPSCSPSDAPALSEACSRLLSTYFIAAKAQCVEGADASMMKTLVKLTLAHTEWRTRLAMALPQRTGHPTAASSPTRAVTALIDAVAAVGLCDATLHFFTAKTLLGECVFRLLESEAWPTWAPEYCSAPLPQQAEHGVSGAFVHGEGGEPPDWQRLYAEVSHRTRLVPASMHTTEPPSPAFSILQLAQDLQDHLERTVQQSHLALSFTEGGV
ncbi:conserved hypothetical protein [Leishmania major strain Friedlin]|uniref:Uncharacterized protein n=1 Tax=Leishmania major TaxID=5664 RepID=Q4Q4G6_LEIMA|nr:conserved hypothetical protein [Leishmania major strain Friedlin]CAG9580604.1 hypothetical_protein_-_conserved [Leishmania major strain Friedlin]CAJ05993.1 conserved hypothetical protein [Leishmania major strain Friedlin]|eukprot:XP_001685782.1 conserved hypothetical protein [Leishmania major strain Friedlin]